VGFWVLFLLFQAGLRRRENDLLALDSEIMNSLPNAHDLHCFCLHKSLTRAPCTASHYIFPCQFTRDSFEGEWKDGMIHGQGNLTVLPLKFGGYTSNRRCLLLARWRDSTPCLHTKHTRVLPHTWNAHAQALSNMQMVANTLANGFKTGIFRFSACPCYPCVHEDTTTSKCGLFIAPARVYVKSVSTSVSEPCACRDVSKREQNLIQRTHESIAQPHLIPDFQPDAWISNDCTNTRAQATRTRNDEPCKRRPIQRLVAE